LAFNVKVLPDAKEEANDRRVKIFQHNVIYHLIDESLEWLQNERNKLSLEEFHRLVKPGKIRILSGFIFRKAKPAIVGVEVLAGRIQPRVVLVKENGEDVGEIMQIQDRGKAVSEAVSGMQVAVSLDKPVVGRHINEKDVLYVQLTENHARALLTKFQDRLAAEELEVVKEYVELMRKKTTPFWAA